MGLCKGYNAYENKHLDLEMLSDISYYTNTVLIIINKPANKPRIPLV